MLRCVDRYTSTLYIMTEEDLNQSYQRLQCYDFAEQESVEGDVSRWFGAVQKKLKCENVDDLTAEKFNVANKPVLTLWLAQARDLMSRQSEVMARMQETIELLKTEALADKDTIIRLQGGLLESKEAQLKSLQTSVQTTVQSAVKSGIQSYSAAVSSNIGTVCSREAIKSAVKSVVSEEDRSRNLILYGVGEEEGEQLSGVVSEVLDAVGEKPHFEATRVGWKRPGSTVRPVKITLRTSTAARQILMKTGKLKLVEKLKDIYISPDRSIEERTARKLLVIDLKRLRVEQPTRTHYIRGGKVCSEDKQST